MLSIKESYRYQNKLNEWISSLERLLHHDAYTVEIKEIHEKSKVLKDAEDEEKMLELEKEYDVTATEIVGKINELIKEKLELAIAVDKAKRNITITLQEGKVAPLDVALEHNRHVRKMATVQLAMLSNKRTTEREGRGQGSTFDNEGRLVQYPYKIREIKSINYDRAKMVKMKKKMLIRSDAISEEVDMKMLEKRVEFEPQYDMHLAMDELLEKEN